MSDRSQISWCDATWNPLAGCSMVSRGCRECYAVREAARLSAMGVKKYDGLTVIQGGRPVWNGTVRLWEPHLDQPLRWKRPRRIFVNSMSDLFHESVPDEWIDRIFAVMALASQHSFQVLTKRPERMRDYLRFPGSMNRNTTQHRHRSIELFPGKTASWIEPLEHVWLGVSAEDQKAADARHAPMRELAAIDWQTWVSYEPATGPVNWTGWEFIRWMVSGGESGPRAEPSHPDWHRATRDWCEANKIPYNFKQWGEWAGDAVVPGTVKPGSIGPERCAWMKTDGRIKALGTGGKESDSDTLMLRVTKFAAGRLLDGRIWDEYPAEMVGARV